MPDGQEDKVTSHTYANRLTLILPSIITITKNMPTGNIYSGASRLRTSSFHLHPRSFFLPKLQLYVIFLSNNASVILFCVSTNIVGSLFKQFSEFKDIISIDIKVKILRLLLLHHLNLRSLVI